MTGADLTAVNVGRYEAPAGAGAPAKPRTRAYVPALDKLRGLALVSVVLFHTLPFAPHDSTSQRLTINVFDLGWAGVDLFFVLSGFLITGILIDERTKPAYFRTFFARRVLRIVPVYVAFLLFSMWAAPLIGATTPATALRLRELQGWFWSYLTNVFIALHGWTAMPDGTSHLWSLAVEEQFYLLWPIAVLVIPQRMLPRVALGCVVAAELCRAAIVVSGVGGEANYVLLPTRMDTLAIGAFLACAVRDPGLLGVLDRWRRPIIGAALLAVLVPTVMQHALSFERPMTQLLAFPAIAIISGGLVLDASRNSRWISALPLQFVGRYSYGMYIWHLVVISVVGHIFAADLPGMIPTSSTPSYLAFVVAVLAGTVAVALVSWYVIEQPFLRLKRFVQYR